MRWHAEICIVLFVLLSLGSHCLAGQSIDEIKKKAEKGDAEAQCSLGTRYAEGNGVPKDYQEAFKWFKKSADQGYAGSQHNLGYIYLKGLGVSKDYGEAMNWYKMAAVQGFKYAHVSLGSMYIEGIGAAQDLVKAYTHYRVAAVLGVDEAEKMIEFIKESHSLAMSEAQILEAKREAEKKLRNFAKTDTSVTFR